MVQANVQERKAVVGKIEYIRERLSVIRLSAKNRDNHGIKINGVPLLRSGTQSHDLPFEPTVVYVSAVGASLCKTFRSFGAAVIPLPYLLHQLSINITLIISNLMRIQ